MDPRRARDAQPLVAAQRRGDVGAGRRREAGRQRRPVLDRLAAPWAMNGSIAWQASPSSVTRPADQRSSGARSNSAQMNGLVDRPDDLPDLRVPAGEGRERVCDLAAVGPRLARPRVLLDDRDEVDQPPAAHEVVHEVPARAHPHLRGHLELEPRSRSAGTSPR